MEDDAEDRKGSYHQSIRYQSRLKLIDEDVESIGNQQDDRHPGPNGNHQHKGNDRSHHDYNRIANQSKHYSH